MGLIKELILLPLAPVRGTVWVAEQLAAEAERQLDPRTLRRRSLLELEQRRAAGEIDDEEYDRLEEEVLRAYTPTTSGGTRNGGLDQQDEAAYERFQLAQRRLAEDHEREHA